MKKLPLLNLYREFFFPERKGYLHKTYLPEVRFFFCVGVEFLTFHILSNVKAVPKLMCNYFFNIS